MSIIPGGMVHHVSTYYDRRIETIFDVVLVFN